MQLCDFCSLLKSGIKTESLTLILTLIRTLILTQARPNTIPDPNPYTSRNPNAVTYLKGPVIIYGWGWARRENISKQNFFLPNPLQNRNIVNPT